MGEGKEPAPATAGAGDDASFRDVARALFRSWLVALEQPDAGAFLDLVAQAIGLGDTPAELAELYEHQARRHRLQHKGSAAAAKGWETRRRNQRDPNRR
jgi:hypothetical protein